MNDLQDLMRNRLSRRTILTGLGVAGLGTAATTLLSGCGSGNKSVSPVTAATFYDRSYTATVLNNGVIAYYLTVLVGTSSGGSTLATNGSVSGTSTFSLTGTLFPEAASETRSVAKTTTKAAGSPTISLTGTVNGSTGVFNLTGTVPSAGTAVTVTGTLPSVPASTGGTAIVTVGGFAYSTVAFSGGSTAGTTTVANDIDVLNFALNLEYAEAEYYLRSYTGSGLQAADIGPNPGTVIGGAQVSFSSTIGPIANEISQDEQAHVRAIRATIVSLGGVPVSRPNIDLTNSFNGAAMAAGLGSSFNPFASEANWIVGGFVFEDVGVTAYHGAAGLISSSAVLDAAAGILATEAYHAGILRSLLINYAPSAVSIANAIIALRAKIDGTAAGSTDQYGGTETYGGNETPLTPSTIAASDSFSLAYGRTTSQVLSIVYANPASGTSSGGFFPNGLAGKIATV